MDDKILGLVSESQVLNSKIFSLPRILILTSLENLGEDGATYRELRAGLGLNDGVLFSNLNALKKMGYVGGRQIKLENKKMTSFSMRKEGKEALDAVREWFKKWLGVGMGG